MLTLQWVLKQTKEWKNQQTLVQGLVGFLLDGKQQESDGSLGGGHQHVVCDF